MSQTQEDNYPPLPARPAGLPWRLGVSSYVYEADLLTNVRQVAGVAEDVELVLFELPDFSNVPSEAEAAELGRLARAQTMTYTVHFPIQYRIGDRDETVRQGFIEQARRIIALTRELPVWAYILHLEGIERSAGREEVERWQTDCSRGIEALLATGVPPELFVVENLAPPFEWHWPVVQRYGLSVCTDIGHLWRAGYDVQQHLERYLPRTRLIHLHGEKAGKDHISLAHVEEVRLGSALRGLREFTGVVTLEVFGFQDAASSIEVLK